MESGTVEWWRRHGWTIGLLFVAFGMALSVRTIWTYPVVAKWGALYTYAGGSDSYYHSRVMTYIIQTHRNLVYDPMLKFPVGATNPREPLFDWMNAVLGIIFAPFFGGNAVNAGAWFLDLQAPLWAALGVFPIYLIGREVTGRRTGLIAALVYPFFSASINTSVFGYADYQSFYTFFLLVVVYAYLRTVKAVGHRRYVQSYRQPKQFVPAIREFFRTERTAVKWSVFTGVALGAFGLAWQGYTYAIIIVAFTALIAMLIERIRHVDSFGLYVSTWIIGLVALPMVAPYYLVQHEIKVFLELPIILFFGTLLLLLPFLMLRDVPWVFSIPALVAVVGAGVLALRFLTPTLFTAAITGDGYFTKNLIYSTVAEAQAPSIDALIVGYGVVTFFLAIVGLVLIGYQLARQRFKRYHIAFLLFGLISVYLPISATKFFLVAAPAYAILSAEGIHRLLDVGGYPQLRRSVASLSDRTNSFAAFRKSFKARHVLVLFLAVMVLLPNIWVSIDAGIPSNTKDAVATQINNTIPSWLKLNASAPGSNYLGAAGSGLDTPNQYDSAAYNWLANQDTAVPEPQRPAFVSWWDYGFQAIDQGQHPSVADNFQNGIDPAGQFLLAQNESLAIGVLAATLLQGEIQETHNPTLPAGLNTILRLDGVNVTALHDYLDNEGADYNLVVNNPQTYLPVNPSTITDDNAMYLAVSFYLADHLSLNGVARVYDDLESYTGWSIRYAMTDSRLFPFTGSDTGIFYAPADLTGRVINSEGVPTTFYNVTILGSDGTTYPLGPLPAGVTAVNYNINWSSPFYRTMLYRIYIGYNGTEVGQSGGIPGLSGAAASDRIEPGWMLQHFEVQYETAYVCPGVVNATPGSACFHAVNRPAAISIANKTNGTSNLTAVQYFEGGESILSYYSGVTLYGRVALPDGTPVPGVRVTVFDGWGIPHMTNVTNANGSFSLVLPPGNDTLNITYGKLDPLNASDANLISSVEIPISDSLGFDPTAPSMVQTFTVPNATVAGLAYWNVSGNSSYTSSTDPVVQGAQVVLNGSGAAEPLSTRTDASGTFVLTDVPPGTYNVSVEASGRTYPEGTKNVSAGASVNLSLALSPGTVNGTVTTPNGAPYAGATVLLSNSSGVLKQATSASSGKFDLSGIAPGTYSVAAVGVDPELTSQRVEVTIGSPGATGTANLTLELRATVEVGVRAAGVALPNATVTFTPQVSFDTLGSSAITSVNASSTDVTLATTNAQGVASAGLPIGTYTAVANGMLGGRLYTGAASFNVTGPGTMPALLLALQPANPVTVNAPAAVQGTVRTAVVAFGPNGTEQIAWPEANGSTPFELGDGAYTFLGLRGTPTSGLTVTAGIVTVNVTGPVTVPLTVGRAVGIRLSVGTPERGGQVYPARNATVVVTTPSGGAMLWASATANGTVGLYLPTTFPGAAGGICVTTSAFGFETNRTCGESPEAVSNLSKLGLQVRPVAVTLGVTGLPAGTNVTVTVTSESVGGTNLTMSGHPSFAFQLPPGLYGVGAKAVIGHGTTVYLPSSILSTTIPLGATYSNLTLVVVPEINASGKLTVPSDLKVADATVQLVSPLLTVTVNGTNFTTSFRATPANYTATTTATTEGGVSYVNVSRVTIYPNGTVRPKIALTTPGVSATVTLREPSGSALVVNTSVTLVTPTGLVLAENAVNGTFTATVAPGTYAVYANATSATPGPNGTYYTIWTNASGSSCTFSAEASTCAVGMTGVVASVHVKGTLVAVGSTTPLPGTLRLVGPYPSRNVTVLSAPNGTFSANLTPGAYYGYGATSGSPYLAGFGQLLALPSARLNISVALEPTWNAVFHFGVTDPANTTVGPANVTVKDAFGDLATFPGVDLRSALTVALPIGNYTVSANASAVFHGIPGTAVASSAIAITNGNLLDTLDLAVPVAATVSGSISGPATASVAAGGQVTFAISYRSTANVPVTVHPVGSPSTWSFNFSFGNITLAPGASGSGEVRITVPNGTLVDHPAITLEFELANGTVAGSVSPAPTVTVLGYYGLAAGRTPQTPAEIGSDHALLPFYVLNSGNTYETIDLTAVDAARLASDGWTVGWVVNNASTPSGSFGLAAGQNYTVEENLTTNGTVPTLPAGSVTVQVSVANASRGLLTDVVLPMPRPEVGTSPGSLQSLGPNVQSGPSPIPIWFVPLVAFVPALALVVGVLTLRWWRTRRWTRR